MAGTSALEREVDSAGKLGPGCEASLAVNKSVACLDVAKVAAVRAPTCDI